MIHAGNTFQDILETIEKAILSGDLATAESKISDPENKAVFKLNPIKEDLLLTQIFWSRGDLETTRRKVVSLLKHTSIKQGSDLWVELMVLRAFAYQTLGHTQKAEKDLEKALKMLPEKSPHSSEIRYNLATLYRDKGDIDQATSLYESVITSPEGSAEIISRSALCIAKMRSDLNQPGVVAYTRHVRDTAPKWGGWAALKTAEILDDLTAFREGNYGTALLQLHRHVMESDESGFTIPRIRARLALAEALVDLGDFAAAKTVIEEAGVILTSIQNSTLKYLQNYIELLWYQADIRQDETRENLWEALDRLEIILAVAAKYPRPPGPAPFWLLIGEIQIRLGQIEQGIRSITRARTEAESIGAASYVASACLQMASVQWDSLDANRKHQGLDRNRILADTTYALEAISRAHRPELEWRIHYLRGKIFSESGEHYPSREEMKSAATIVDNLIRSLDNPSLQSIYRKCSSRHEALLELQSIYELLQTTAASVAAQTAPLPQTDQIDHDELNADRKLQDLMNAMLELHSAGSQQMLFDSLMMHANQILNAERAAIVGGNLDSGLAGLQVKSRTEAVDSAMIDIPEKWLREAFSTRGVLTYLREIDEKNPEARHIAIAAIREQGAPKAALCVDRPKLNGPFQSDELTMLSTLVSVAGVAASSLSIQRRLAEISEQLRREIVPVFSHIVGQSEPMKRVFVQMQRVAPSNLPLLIQGETGTGKDLVARTVHEIGPRSGCPIVHLDCSAIPMTLLESELFGIEEGIATGVESRIGLIEYANGGTILMDEVGDIPLNTQAKLLRVLQEHEFEPVGSNRVVAVDIRIIATTTRSLVDLIREGKLREDFYYRISGLVISLPPLKERAGDIVLLARTFLQKYNREFRRNIKGFTPDLLDTMVAYSWPGNVREMDHMIRKAVLFCHSDRISVLDMELPTDGQCRMTLEEALCRMESTVAKQVLESAQGDIRKAASALKISVKQLEKLIRPADDGAEGEKE